MLSNDQNGFQENSAQFSNKYSAKEQKIFLSKLAICYKMYRYSVFHNSISPSKELYSKMALGKVGVSFP